MRKIRGTLTGFGSRASSITKGSKGEGRDSKLLPRDATAPPGDVKNTFAKQVIPALAKKYGMPLTKAEIAANTDNTLRVCSFNLHFHTEYLVEPIDGRAYNERCAEAIKSLDPDVIVLEEVVNVESVLSKDDYPYIVFFAPTGGSNGMGNAICSKYELSDAKSVKFTATEEEPNLEARCYVAATVEPKPDVQVRIIGTHLDVWDETGKTRCHQLKQLQSEAESCDIENVVILGDFNALYKKDYNSKHWKWIEDRDKGRDPPVETTSDALNLMINELNWRDAFRESLSFQGKKRRGDRSTVEVPTITVWSLRRIDFILLSPQWTLPVSNAMILYTAASDHTPIGVDFDLS